MKKDWSINKDGSVTHVVPNNDLKPHVEDFQERGLPACRCSCKPEIKFFENPRYWIVIHNSWDGREVVEWAEDILKTL
jgi:hypothetical protein